MNQRRRESKKYNLIRTPSIATAMPADPSPPPWKLYHNPHFLSPSMDALSLEISDLRAQLALERRLRLAAESLAESIAQDLADERRARADADAEAARCRAAMREAEGWTEERVKVKVKLAQAAVAVKENPHVRRGMNGFVEFSRAIRVRSPGTEKGRVGRDLEGERAQLRVLMK